LGVGLVRIVFNVLGLLVVVAIVGSIARTQLHALNAPSSSSAAAAASAAAVSASEMPAAAVPMRDLPQQIGQDVSRAMQPAPGRGDDGTAPAGDK
jgi:hypothetical protein